MDKPVWNQIIDCLMAFQTLATGFLAVFGAMLTAGVIYLAARLPIKEQRKRKKIDEGRKVRLRSLELSEELKQLERRAGQGQSTVKVHKDSNKDVNEFTRQKMRLRKPSPILDWEYMSLLPEEIAREILQLISFIEDHNFDIDRVGGSFGGDNFGRSIIDRLETIKNKSTELRAKVLEVAGPQ